MAAIDPTDVHRVLGRHMLVDGYPIVLDTELSTPFVLRDAASGKEYLDFFTYFASSPFGNNHPKMLEEEFIAKLGRIAVNKVSNSDIYTVEMAELVEAMSRFLIPDYLPHLFFVSGGALAVENALKVAFDWKVRKNLEAGRGELGSKIIHFRHAFHGRTGYTLSLTNTADPRKYQYFPLFDWPRIDPPMLQFPVDEDEALKNDEAAFAAIEQAFADNPHDIAGILIEPIQAEGGDHHFTDRFLQGLKDICDRNEAVFILDEVQTGMGITGVMWAHQAQNVKPDIIAFGKKTQVCGILAGPKIDEVEKNCFVESSRINSTWGGNLVDMVRFTRIIEIMEEDDLVENARVVGAYLLERLGELETEFEQVSNVRGRGLFCAFDLPDGDARDACVNRCMEEGMLILGCGNVSVRFRPPLQTTKEHVDQGIGILKTVLAG